MQDTTTRVLDENLLWQLFRSQNLNGLIDLVRNYDASRPGLRTELLLFFEKRFGSVKQNNFGLRFFIELSLLLGDSAGAFLFLEEYYERSPDLDLLHNYIKKLLSLQTLPVGFVEFLKKHQKDDVLFTEWLGETYSKAGNLEGAHQLFQELMEAYPHDINIKKRAARMALKAADFVSAAPLYESLIKEKNITLDEMISFIDSAVESSQVSVDFLVFASQIYQKAMMPEEASRSLARAYQYAPEQFEQILKKSREVLKIFPGFPEALFLNAQILADQKNYSEAIKTLNDIVKNNPEHVDRAIPFYEKILEKYPTQVLARQSLGEIFLAQNKIESAMHQFEFLLNHDPDAAEMVSEKLLRFIKKEPGHFGARSILAKAYFLSNQIPKALTEAEVVIENEPTALAYQVLAQVKISGLDYLSAQKALEQAMALAPNDKTILKDYEWVRLKIIDQKIFSISKHSENLAAEDCLKLAKLYFQKYDLKAALSHLALAEKKFPTPALLLAGVIEKELGHFEKAIAYFREALNLSAGEDAAELQKLYFYLGLAYEALAENGQALNAYEHIVLDTAKFASLNLRKENLKKVPRKGRLVSAVCKKEEPNSSELILMAHCLSQDITENASDAIKQAVLLNDLGVNHLLKGRLQQAEEKLMQALKSYPKLKMAYLNLGYVFMLSEKWSEAEEAFKYLEKQDDPNAFYALGLFYYLYRKTDQALYYFQKAFEVQNDLHAEQICFGDLLYQLGQVERAIRLWERAEILGVLPELSSRRLLFKRSVS